MTSPKTCFKPRWLALAAAMLALSLATFGCRLSSLARDREASLAASEHVVRAETLYKEGRLEEALAEFSRAIENNPTLGEAHIGVGQVHQAQGDYQAAEESYRRAAELEPRNFEAQYHHGLALQLLDRLTEAVRVYLRALSIDPDDFEANLNLATAYLQLGEPRQALPYARRAAALNPESGPARSNLGAVHSALDQHERAIREYQAAAELMDLSAPLLLNLADSLGKVGRFKEMANTLEQALEIEPSAQAHERLGFAYFRLRRYGDALAQFREAVEHDPQHYPALNGVGVCLLNRYLMSDRENAEARAGAVEALRRSLRIKRDQPRIIELLNRYG